MHMFISIVYNCRINNNKTKEKRFEKKVILNVIKYPLNHFFVKNFVYYNRNNMSQKFKKPFQNHIFLEFILARWFVLFT